MKRTFRQISVTLCLFMMLSAFASCDLFMGDGSTESISLENSESSSVSLGSESFETESSEDETTEETTEEETTEETTEEETTEEETTEEVFETELVEDVISFVDYTRTQRSLHDLKTGEKAAVSFTIPDGQLKKLYINLTDKLVSSTWYTTCSIKVDIYSFDGNYRSTIKTEPIYSEYITSTLRTYTICFEDGQMPAGDYLMVLSYVEDESGAANEDEIYGGVLVDTLWYAKTIPEEYEQYNIASYIGDSKDRKFVFCGGFVIEHSVAKSDEEPESDIENEDEYPENAAKVILIGGQSNATGATHGSFLENNVPYEKYVEYLRGYSNVKILYSSGTVNSGVVNIANYSESFVDTKLGQGIGTTRFGPELGLAAYLSENYPDETFYIIKYAIGSTGLGAHWNPTNESRNTCLVEFKETVDLGLDLLKQEGLDPKIVAFLWMQGESDATTFKAARDYYDLQKALVENIREEYAVYEAPHGIAFIDAAVSESGMWQSAFLLNQSKLAYSKESEINFYIDTNALGLDTMQENNDPAHYDSTSMILLGELYGIELSKILN